MVTRPARIRTIVVDDEPLARERIMSQIAVDPEIEVLGECETGERAILDIGRCEPDLVFLDVQLPDIDGFGVLESLGDAHIPAVIFVTAYDEFALRAFDIHAMDYVLKPFSPERFQRSLGHAKERLHMPGTDLRHPESEILADLRRAGRYLDRMLVGDNDRRVLLTTSDVDWFEANRNLVIVHSGGKRRTFRTTMENLAAALDPACFARIHRSTIVNLDRIKEVQSWFHGNWRVILKDGTSLMLSSRYRESLARFRRVP